VARGYHVDTNFARNTHYKIWGDKKRPKFLAILATLDFDRQYPRNESTCRKSEKQFINYVHLTLGEKNW